MSITVTFRLEQAVSDLTFPLPAGATNIKKDGSAVRTSTANGAIHVELGDYVGGLVGSFTMRFEYSLKGVIINEKGNLVMELPLLSGFAYPVERMDFTITMPGIVEGNPKFTSIYHQESMDSFLQYAISGNMISGQITATLQDHEAMLLRLDVPEDMFPSVSTYHRTGNPELIPMGICAILALLYWLLFLRTMPVLPGAEKTPPEGITAGELGCRLTLAGADLGLMVFSWAQLGYITIQLDDRGRVYLHKRMDMGNERNLFEVRMFQSLFDKRQVVEATGYGFAKLSRRVRAMVPGARSVCIKASGNPRIFRVLCCGIQVFCGICFAMTISQYPVVQTILSILFAIVGVVSGWQIQSAFSYLHLYPRLPKVMGALFALVWIGLGAACGQWAIALGCAAAQALGGFAAAYGGRRSDVGRANLSQILGLRKYMKTIGGDEIAKMLRHDPEFFFNLAPYALALGVGKAFAARFGRRPMPVCPYIITGIRGRLNAQDWMVIMQAISRSMHLLQRRMDRERWAVIRFR